jgi:hypothetical protein
MLLKLCHFSIFPKKDKKSPSFETAEDGHAPPSLRQPGYPCWRPLRPTTEDPQLCVTGFLRFCPDPRLFKSILNPEPLLQYTFRRKKTWFERARRQQKGALIIPFDNPAIRVVYYCDRGPVDKKPGFKGSRALTEWIESPDG